MIPSNPLANAAEDAAPAAQIQDYGIIGDCRSAALISRQGSLDWLCWPQFDSPAIFSGLLDPDRGGHWRICPLKVRAVRRQYVSETNILQTTFDCESGAALLTDLMPVASEEFKRRAPLPDHEIIRQLECTSGTIEVEVEFLPRVSFGLQPVALQERGKLGIQFPVGRGVYWLRSSLPLAMDGGKCGARAVLHAGERLEFSLSYCEGTPAILPALGAWSTESITRSAAWWQQWSRRAGYEGPYREAVLRSALTLKLLNYAPSGAIVAAATTSLPERIGGPLNWDYRYCWLRDASLTIRALLGLGYHEEAADFMEWMLQATWLTRPELRIMYTVYGDQAPSERSLDYLSGFRGSRPVRVGNGARHQLQLDVYGEVIDAAAQYAFYGGTFDSEMRKTLIAMGNYVVGHWDSVDEGIWEPRNGRQNHTHSRVLCWTALDRLISLRGKGLLDGAPLDSFKKNCELLRRQIHECAWNDRLQSYASVLGGSDLDAALLLIPWYGFEKADTPRMQATHRAIRQNLGAPQDLLYRYSCEPPEGAFAICSFWEVEFLALGGGSLEDTHALFRNLLRFQNDLGLYAEEIDPATGGALGNFPQAFTHVGLIGAALSIEEREQGLRQLAHRPESAAHRSAAVEAQP
jgi:GH15 family glucan-1,4-alpha-glucosidase